jgi:hypothetical protein
MLRLWRRTRSMCSPCRKKPRAVRALYPARRAGGVPRELRSAAPGMGARLLSRERRDKLSEAWKTVVPPIVRATRDV